MLGGGKDIAYLGDWLKNKNQLRFWNNKENSLNKE